MGTRAAFWIGNPMELEKREWLGCVSWDGYPDGIDGIDKVKTEQDFRNLVMQQSKRRDFAKPSGGWPYPWADNIFLTDFTYAFFDGKLQLTCFHKGFMSLKHYKRYCDEGEKSPNTLPENVPAPKPYDNSQPDSIMIFRRG